MWIDHHLRNYYERMRYFLFEDRCCEIRIQGEAGSLITLARRNQTVMSGRIKAGFVDFFYFRWRLIAFVAFRRGRFWCETGAVRHQANCTVGSNPSLSATLF
jgi:hypothetical protein